MNLLSIRRGRHGIVWFIGVTIAVRTTAFVPELRGSARLFLDTADPKEWEDLLPTGIFEGVTCNPTLLERANQKCTIANLHALSKRALNLSADEIMVQAWGATSQELYECGMALSRPDHERIVIKVPIVSAGVEAAAKLVRSNVRVCLTACYHHKQALIAANVGAEYLAPYLGRMTDAGRDGVEECLKMQQIIGGLQADTRVLVASIRDCQTMVNLAAEGMETFTISPQVARELFVEPLTKEAAKAFEEAASRNN
jgi:transaldolase